MGMSWRREGVLLAQDRTRSPRANIGFGPTPGRRTRASDPCSQSAPIQTLFEQLPSDNLQTVVLSKAAFEWGVSSRVGGSVRRPLVLAHCTTSPALRSDSRWRVILTILWGCQPAGHWWGEGGGGGTRRCHSSQAEGREGSVWWV